MIEEWVSLIRIIAIGSGLTLVAMVVASEVRLSIRIPLLGMVIGSIGYLLNTGPFADTLGAAKPWTDLVALSTPFWIWLFGRRLFEREPERRLLLATAAVMLFGWFIGNFVPFTGLAGFLILHVAALALVVDLVRIGVFEREDDLVEQRRIVRLWLPLLVALQAGQILLVEMLELMSPLDSRYPPLTLMNSVVIVMIMLFAALTLFRTDRELLPTEGEEQSAIPDVPTPDLSASEAVLNEKLNAAMSDGVWREQGVTIARLAEHLETPEHRLRALINRRLGYRNFSAFLNRHRIAEAREKLSDRELVDLPILTIAMDIGYNSLAPFNRAFKAETGRTPSAFRQKALGESGDRN